MIDAASLGLSGQDLRHLRDAIPTQTRNLAGTSDPRAAGCGRRRSVATRSHPHQHRPPSARVARLALRPADARTLRDLISASTRVESPDGAGAAGHKKATVLRCFFLAGRGGRARPPYHLLNLQPRFSSAKGIVHPHGPRLRTTGGSVSCRRPRVLPP